MGKTAAMNHEITRLLLALDDSNKNLIDELFPLVYNELQKIAKRQLRGERANHTINTTALVHEAYLKLVDQTRMQWQNRAHFFAIAAQAMRRILINYANKRLASKRGGGEPLATFDEGSMKREAQAQQLIDLDEALEELFKTNERLGKVVECRFFGGLTQEEIAEVLNISVPTVRRDWRLARAWLSREISRN